MVLVPALGMACESGLLLLATAVTDKGFSAVVAFLPSDHPGVELLSENGATGGFTVQIPRARAT